MTPLLRVRGLTKSFAARRVLNVAHLELQAGLRYVITGDNGAGKSTFVRQITGVEQRTRGKVVFDGREVNFSGPLDAREAGIETVFQNLALADDLDVPSNLFLGREKIWLNLGPFSILDFKGMRAATEKALLRTAVKIPNLSNSIRKMSGGQRQCVAIARTATFASKLIIMDEPTAALGVRQTAMVLGLIKRLREEGHGVVVISHNLADVFEVADRIFVLRLGRKAGDYAVGEATTEQIVGAITGASDKPTDGSGDEK